LLAPTDLQFSHAEVNDNLATPRLIAGVLPQFLRKHSYAHVRCQPWWIIIPLRPAYGANKWNNIPILEGNVA
jgi:hypothetical protein